ncbi:MAG: ribosomal protein L7/L12 [Solirubrobacteraceae bacterium]
MSDIIVKKYKGERALERGLNEMAKKGYVVDQQASRKALYSAATGVFTRKQIHTVTFRKQRSSAPVSPLAARSAPASPPAARPAPDPTTHQAPSVDMIGQLERLSKLRDSSVLTTEEFEAQKALLLGNPPAAAEEHSLDIVVTGLVPGTSKIQAIKSICNVDGLGLGLAEAKQIVDDADSKPTVLLSCPEQADADSLKDALESAGLIIEIRPR